MLVSHRQAESETVRVRPLAERHSKHRFEEIRTDPHDPTPDAGGLVAQLDQLADRIRRARACGASVLLCYGAHLIKNGLGPVVADLLRGGWITHLATNGAGVIHDWEYAFHGRSEEDVRGNVADGTFGAWDETGRYTLMAIAVGATHGMGYGESIGRLVREGGLRVPEREALQQQLRAWLQAPEGDEHAGAVTDLLRCMIAGQWDEGWIPIDHSMAQISLTATADALRIPLTVHPGIGYDIVYVHPQADGAVFGRAAGIDFRVLCQSVYELGAAGVVMSVGSAVTAPQVFEKAASVANNLRRQHGEDAISPYIAVNDLQPATWDWSNGEPPASEADYYLRFLKSFSRVAPEPLNYLGADNRLVLLNLHQRLMD
ncbi:MAG: hypothetical protein CME24_21780 [Gemmatimonadetes bacterium]|nr:hypothetical protein [Gemmatimonadota bacterium]